MVFWASFPDAADIQERMPFKAVHMRLTIDEEECRMQYDALEDIWFLHRMVPPNLGIACAVTVVPHTQDSAAHELQLQPCDTKTGSIIGQVLDVWMTAAASSEGSECDGSCPLPTAIPQHAQTDIVAKPRPMSSPGMRTASDLQSKLSPLASQTLSAIKAVTTSVTIKSATTHVTTSATPTFCWHICLHDLAQRPSLLAQKRIQTEEH